MNSNINDMVIPEKQGALPTKPPVKGNWLVFYPPYSKIPWPYSNKDIMSIKPVQEYHSNFLGSRDKQIIEQEALIAAKLRLFAIK